MLSLGLQTIMEVVLAMVPLETKPAGRAEGFRAAERRVTATGAATTAAEKATVEAIVKGFGLEAKERGEYGRAPSLLPYLKGVGEIPCFQRLMQRIPFFQRLMLTVGGGELNQIYISR